MFRVKTTSVWPIANTAMIATLVETRLKSLALR